MKGPDPGFEAFLGMEEVQAWLGAIPRGKTRRTYGRALFQYRNLNSFARLRAVSMFLPTLLG